jgi:hypothetical protein
MPGISSSKDFPSLIYHQRANRDLRDLSQNIEKAAHTTARQERYTVKIYFALEQAART